MTAIKDYRMLIDGAWVSASDGGMFDSLNPATGDIWCRVPEATAEDVDRAVRAAHRAFTQGPWAEMTPSVRGRCLHKLGDLLAEQSENLGRTETIDTGKMLKETRWQAKYIAEFFHFYTGCADKISGETLPIDKPDLFVFTRREPLGVVVVMRERHGRTLPVVTMSEAEGVSLVNANVGRMATLSADEASHWDMLHAGWSVDRVNHSLVYSDHGKHTNWAESYFSRLRRMVVGQHHKVSPQYLHQYANQAAWLEDNRRKSNGALAFGLVANAMGCPISRAWKGYLSHPVR